MVTVVRLTVRSSYYRRSNYFSCSVMENTVLLVCAVISLYLVIVGKYFEVYSAYFLSKEFLNRKRPFTNKSVI